MKCSCFFFFGGGGSPKGDVLLQGVSSVIKFLLEKEVCAVLLSSVVSGLTDVYCILGQDTCTVTLSTHVYL